MMKLPILVAIAILWCSSGTNAAEEPGPMWPSAPIAVSPVEGVIEGFWNPSLKATTRWKGESGTLTGNWDACFFKMQATPLGGEAAMSRNYQLQIGDYQRLRVRLRPGKDVTTTIVAEIDGKAQTVAETSADTNDAFEMAGPIRGNTLTRLTLKFTLEPGASIQPPENEKDGSSTSHAIQLRWIMLEKDGNAWTPPQEPFKGMVVEESVGRFEPGLGLLFGREELEQMRDVVASPAFDAAWKADQQYAATESEVDPASLIRPCSLYGLTRYGRDTDLQYETVHDGVILALVGLLSRNEEYLRQAARHAVALASIEQWSEGFVDRMPGYPWYHSGFAPNVATIKASLLLDWTWHYLTPDGRQLIREAIAKKGLPYAERAKDAMANQGVRFNKGLILGKMALADSLDDPDLQQYVRACIDRINGNLSSIVRADGTFSEEMNYYGKGTMACTPISYHAASRCLGVPIAKLVTPRMLPAMRYIITADGRLNAGMAAFCAGPLGDETFASQCVPTGLLHNFVDDDFPTEQHEGNRVEYIFFGLAPLWAPALHESQQQPPLPAFSVYRDGGWLFGGSDNPAAPRFSFESGFWDGHGHSWFHKNAVTLDGWGERLLISRMHLPYSDARSQYTMQTKLYNTFAPSGRNQNASGSRGRGAKLITAEDLGPVAVIESDNATAWRSGVQRCVRRLLFIRPNIVIVHDDAQFTEDEPGVQSWNSFRPWQTVDGRTCLSRDGKAAVRLTVVLPEQVQVATSEDSVSHERGPESPIEIPVYRAAFTSLAGKDHEMLTVVEAIASGADEKQASLKVLDGGGIEVRQGQVVVRLFPHPGESASENSSGFTTDGRLLFVVTRQDRTVAAGAFGATRLTGRDCAVQGDGFLYWAAPDGQTNK